MPKTSVGTGQTDPHSTKLGSESKQPKDVPEEAQPEEEGKGEPYVCSFCGTRFSTHQGLGGHISKKHKQMSAAFREKQTRREQRTTERLVTKIAKEVILKQRNGEPVDPEFQIPTRRRRDDRTNHLRTGNLTEYERGRLRKIKVIILKRLERSGSV